MNLCDLQLHGMTMWILVHRTFLDGAFQWWKSSDIKHTCTHSLSSCRDAGKREEATVPVLTLSCMITLLCLPLFFKTKTHMCTKPMLPLFGWTYFHFPLLSSQEKKRKRMSIQQHQENCLGLWGHHFQVWLLLRWQPTQEQHRRGK